MSSGEIIGTGIDLVENARLEKILQRWDRHFLDKVFTVAEQEYSRGKARPAQHLAARFAVKEAVSKAFSTGIGPHFGWLDIEVLRDEASGAPSVRLHGSAAEYAEKLGGCEVLISLSHTRQYAVASAVLVRK